MVTPAGGRGGRPYGSALKPVCAIHTVCMVKFYFCIHCKKCHSKKIWWSIWSRSKLWVDVSNIVHHFFLKCLICFIHKITIFCKDDILVFDWLKPNSLVQTTSDTVQVIYFEIWPDHFWGGKGKSLNQYLINWGFQKAIQNGWKWKAVWKGFEKIAVPEAFHLGRKKEQCTVNLPTLPRDQHQHQHLKQVARRTFCCQQNSQSRIRFVQTEELNRQATVHHSNGETVYWGAKSEYGQYLGAPEVQGDEIKAVQDETKGLHTWAS